MREWLDVHWACTLDAFKDFVADQADQETANEHCAHLARRPR